MTSKTDIGPKGHHTSESDHLGGTKFGRAPEIAEENRAPASSQQEFLHEEAAEHEVKMTEARKKARPDDDDYRPLFVRSSPD